ncbi:MULTISPECIES: hypothetical protein [unclassified Janthinobacterium]|uniref:hypothetical protein n=1 Tax=unclassified Janthinobacterium TaxID=2610881 RepID=UPI00034647FA|nr:MULTISPECIES: hypothetical protein [unclassified Janthinobacterium]MEC5159789.1 hypothetical protein [Janthinobacterium sp. CG_S6]
MLTPSILLLLAVLAAGRTIKTPLAIYCLAWLACMIPSAIGLINYHFIGDENDFARYVLFGYNVLFVAGYQLAEYYYAGAGARRAAPPAGNAALHAAISGRVALVAMVGVGMAIIDFKLFQGIVLEDFSQMRDSFHARQVNALTQIGSLLSWGALYALPYLIVNWSGLSLARRVYYAIPAVGLFYFGILSAGRQAAFQILIISSLSFLYRGIVTGSRVKLSLAFKAALAALPVLMILYMGIVAHQRNDGLISESKTAVLELLFDFSLDPLANSVADSVGPAFKDGIVEGVVYFNSPVNLFSVFLAQPHPPAYHGLMTFPLVARRFDSFGDTTVVQAMEATSKMMANAGVINVGWATSYGSLILDFGLAGCAVLMLLLGLLSSCAWRIFLRERSFASFMLVLCACIHIIYIPLLPAISDTNVFLLTIFSVLIWKYSKTAR